MARSVKDLGARFFDSVSNHPDRLALTIGDLRYSYEALGQMAQNIAGTLQQVSPHPKTPLTAVLGHRHVTAFAGILGALARGHGYVPLNPTFPLPRLIDMVIRSECETLVVDDLALPLLPDLLPEIPVTISIIATGDLTQLRQTFPDRVLVNPIADTQPLERTSPRGDISYLLFTSGSTGKPKAVAVSHRNVDWFLNVMLERYQIAKDDRFSQTFDLTFDLSVFDMFMPWSVGASLHVPTAAEKMLPSKYIKKNELTVWFSVPSTAILLDKLRLLKPNEYPTLRWSLFCGEALALEVAQKFGAAAHQSIVENLYGPTELTIACTYYRLNDNSKNESQDGLVPIGVPYPGLTALVVNEDSSPVAPGESGELLVAGPQVSLGYFNDPDRTAAAFVVPPGQTETFYRTGDRVLNQTPLLYKGRADNQIKVQGYRVELGEIEAKAREVVPESTHIALGHPITSSGIADGVALVVSPPPKLSVADLNTELRSRLPSYMQPNRIEYWAELPLNSNGKVDRREVAQRLVDKTSSDKAGAQ